MLSSTYQQSSDNNPRYAQIDPQNRLLWRANIRRLEFEAMRDSHPRHRRTTGLDHGRPPSAIWARAAFSHRRTIYGKVDRRNLPEVYSQFDFANPDITTGKRYETTVPQQALFMMNNPLVVEQARSLVNRNDFRQAPSAEDRVRLLYNLIYQRDPTPVEIDLGLDFLRESPPAEMPEAPIPAANERARRGDQKGKRKRGGPAMSLATIPRSGLQPIGAWAKYAHALMQANEAMFVD